MGILDIARDTLKEIPMADVLRERLSLALEHSAELERYNTILQSEKATAKAELEIERLHHQETQQELESLRKEHEEEIRISLAIEFRRGKRTGNQWIAFCPRCHLPALIVNRSKPCCSDGKCHWAANIDTREIEQIVNQLL